MTLNEYIAQERGKAVELARKTGLSTSSISRLAKGQQDPSLNAMRLIQEATEGVVAASDWIPAQGDAA